MISRRGRRVGQITLIHTTRLSICAAPTIIYSFEIPISKFKQCASCFPTQPNEHRRASRQRDLGARAIERGTHLHGTDGLPCIVACAALVCGASDTSTRVVRNDLITGGSSEAQRPTIASRRPG